jgi:Fe/S biogenesis protein NfuA
MENLMNRRLNTENLDIVVTDPAVLYFERLLTKEAKNTNIRITVGNPGTIYADVKVSFCPSGKEENSDFAMRFTTFYLFIEENSMPFLKEAKIDYIENEDDELSIKAPHLKQNKNDTRTLEERIQCVIDNEINPILESHGGMIALEGILEESIVLLRFGGGCRGCRVADVTFQQTVEHILKQHFPQLKEIRNITDQIETY